MWSANWQPFMKPFWLKYILSALFLLSGACILKAQTVEGPHVLVVIAHPDDESEFSVTLYKIVKEQHGTVDLFVITDGEAGYKYSTLAEQYYGLELTNEQTGRSNLPRIRKQELKNAGRILGISHYYFADQVDAHYSLNEKGPLDTTWNVSAIKNRLNRVISKTHYDYVFCMLPEPSTHGAHKAAALITLNTIKYLPLDNRPIVLGAMTRNKADTVFAFTKYADYAETGTASPTASFDIDRTASFSYKDRVNYKVIANWEIAEHKSQGATQMTMNDGDLEEFWYFSINGPSGFNKCNVLFKTLKQTPYIAKTYR